MTRQLKTFRVRDFLNYTPDQLANAHGQVNILFDDGQVGQADHRQIRYSRHAWEIQKQFKTPITQRHMVQTWMSGEGLYTKMTHLSLTAACMFDALDHYNPQGMERDKLLHDLTKLSYKVMGDIYNTYTVAGLRYVRDVHIGDFADLYRYPPFYNTLAKTARDVTELIAQYAELKRIVLKDPSVSHLKLVSLARAGLIKLDQLLQCFLCGLLTDIDSQAFLRHISTGYYQGIRSFIDFMAASRSAPKALIYTTVPLQTSEFWNRRSQFLGIRARRLRHCDCGSQSYFLHLMRPKREVDGEIFRSDVEAFQGTYYLNEETGQVQPILPTDKHLEGKMLKLRSVLAGCDLLEKDAICAVCYGAQSDSIFKEQAPGYMCTIVICGNVGQRTMGVKHLDGGASAIKGVSLTPVGSRYLLAPQGGFSYFLRKELGRSSALFLACEASAAAGVIHMSPEIDPATIDCTTISSLDMMDIVIEQADKNRTITETLDVTSGRRKTSFSPEFLKFIRQGERIRMEGNRRLVFDMSGWDFSQPLLTLPMRHFNVADHQSLVSKLIEATTKDSIKRAQTLLPTTLCLRLLEALNSHADITWSTAATMIYATLNVDVRKGDVSLPKTWTGAQVGSHRRSMMAATLSLWLSFQGHTAMFRSARTFLNSSHGVKPRPDMLDYDMIFDPKGVFETYPELYPPQTAEGVKAIELGGFEIPA